MKKLEITMEYLDETIISLQNYCPLAPHPVQKHISKASDLLVGFRTIINLIHSGCGIIGLRKFINLHPQKPPKDEEIINNTEGTKQDPQGGISQGGGSQDKPKKKVPSDINKNHKGRQDANDFPNAPKVNHVIPGVIPGCTCLNPDCKGKLYPHKRLGEHSIRVWFSGQPPVSPTLHVFEDYRCNLCKDVFYAQPTKELVEDGLGKEDRFGYSAIAMISILKYFEAFPWYRNADLHSYFEVHLPESTQVGSGCKTRRERSPHT